MNKEEVKLMEKYEEKIQDEKYKIYCLEQKISELENINDKLSSALNSAEQRIDEAIEYIENNIGEDNNGCGVWWYSFPDYTTPDELLSILKGENNE